MRGPGLIDSRMAQRLEEQRSFDEGCYLVVQFGGTGLETVLDEPGQERHEVDRFDRRGRDRVGRPGADCGGQTVGEQDRAVRLENGLLEDTLQLTYVPGPGITLEQLQHFGSDSVHFLT